MPTIVFASSKGGAGKTTAAIILASELVRRGRAVTLVDADPNRHLAAWAGDLTGDMAGDAAENPFARIVRTSEDRILDDLTAAGGSGFVIVDLEGRANVAMSYAVSMADLVIIPCRASDLDGREAIRVLGFIRQQERLLGRPVAAALLRTQVNAAIHTRIERAIIDDMTAAGCAVFDNRLVERDAFRRMVSHGCLLHDLDAEDRRALEARERAVAAAKAFADEVIRRFEAVGTGNPVSWDVVDRHVVDRDGEQPREEWNGRRPPSPQTLAGDVG